MANILDNFSNQKSFYGKAKVETDGEGNRWLLSYNTRVCGVRGGKLVRTWGDWSATTAKHIKAFCGLCGVEAPNKAQWLEMSVER